MMACKSACTRRCTSRLSKSFSIHHYTYQPKEGRGPVAAPAGCHAEPAVHALRAVRLAAGTPLLARPLLLKPEPDGDLQHIHLYREPWRTLP